MSTSPTSRALRMAILVAAATALSACQRADETAQRSDTPIASTTRQPATTPSNTTTPPTASDSMGQKMDQATNKLASTVEDAAITAGVNAELAKDTQLSALRIDVDTTGGKVTLSGKAPDTASRARATTLALGVKGVTGVDNRLEIGG